MKIERETRIGAFMFAFLTLALLTFICFYYLLADRLIFTHILIKLE